MSNKLYKSGESAEVGDIVQCVDTSSSSYYNNFSLKGTAEYEVVAVIPGAKSTLLQIRSDYKVYFNYKISRFNLVRRADGFNEATLKTDIAKKLMVTETINSTTRIVGMFDNEGKLTEILRKLLTEKPNRVFNVYEFISQAKTKPVQIIFDGSIGDSSIENQTPEKFKSQMFTKK